MARTISENAIMAKMQALPQFLQVLLVVGLIMAGFIVAFFVWKFIGLFGAFWIAGEGMAVGHPTALGVLAVALWIGTIASAILSAMFLAEEL